MVFVKVDGHCVGKLPIGIETQLQRCDGILTGEGGIELVHDWTADNGIVASVALPQTGEPARGRQDDQDDRIQAVWEGSRHLCCRVLCCIRSVIRVGIRVTLEASISIASFESLVDGLIR